MTTTAIARLWAETFADTWVITTDGREQRLQRLMCTLPFDPALLSVDSCPPGLDCLTGRPHDNHHVVVGNRHKRIVETAARRGLRNVCVLEDDAEFVDVDRATLEVVLKWVRDHEDRWDIFYLGFGAPFFTRCAYVTRHVIRAHRPFLAHAICYNRRIYDEILDVDLTGDHRPFVFRTIERLLLAGRRDDRYFREGVGSLDTWLSFSRLRKFASHPILAVQTVLPPGTEAGWERRTGRRYDVRRTPRRQVEIALAVNYALWGLGGLLILGLVGGFYLHG